MFCPRNTKCQALSLTKINCKYTTNEHWPLKVYVDYYTRMQSEKGVSTLFMAGGSARVPTFFHWQGLNSIKSPPNQLSRHTHQFRQSRVSCKNLFLAMIWSHQIIYSYLSRCEADDLEIMWSYRHYMYDYPCMLPWLLQAAHSWDWACLSDTYRLLSQWKTLEPMQSLELLLPE